MRQNETRNPYLENIAIRGTKIPALRQFEQFEEFTVDENGFIDISNFKGETHLVDSAKKTNVYLENKLDVNMYLYCKSSGRDLLLYIIYNLQKGKDYIELNTTKVTASMGCSRATYYNAISQVCGLGVITKKSGSVYWVNPMYIFNGNRMEFILGVCPECITQTPMKRFKKKKS